MSDELRADLHDAIHQVLTKHGEYTHRWTACIETIEEDNGKLGLWTVASPGLTGWDRLGMLAYAQQRIQASVVESMLTEDDDDD